MAIQEKTFAQQAVDDSNETIYTATDTDILKTLIVTNNHTADVTVTIWVVPNSGSASDENVIIFERNVPIGDFFQLITYIPMETTGDSVVAVCSVADKATIYLGGASIT